jgi:hypothetical protein
MPESTSFLAKPLWQRRDGQALPTAPDTPEYSLGDTVTRFGGRECGFPPMPQDDGPSTRL